MWAGDAASRGLGMELVDVAPGPRDAADDGRARTWSTGTRSGTAGSRSRWPTPRSRSRATPTTAARSRPACEIRFLAPTRLGDVLVAEAVERSREGRDGVYDVTVRVRRRPWWRSSWAAARRSAGTLFDEELTRGRARARGRPELRRRRAAGAPARPAARRRCARAYDHVPHYRHAFDDAGVRPTTCTSLADLARFPFTAKADLRAELPVRHVRRAARAGQPRARLVRHDRQADRRRLHRARTSTPGPR